MGSDEKKEKEMRGKEKEEKKGDELSKFADCPQIHRRPQLLVVLIRSLAMQSPTSGRRQRRRLHKLFAER